MEDGKTKVIIDRLIDMIENGASVPLSSAKVAVNKDEALNMLRELDSIVTGELKVYRDVNDRKGRIISDAKKEAEDIIYEAEQTASRIRVTKRMSNIGTGFRADGLDKEDKLALRTAHDIYAASVIYTDEMLTEVNDVVAQAYDVINNQYGKMVKVLEEKAQLIAENKTELMAGLRELSKEERYSQIMELSQLLANELYNERKRKNDLNDEVAEYSSVDDFSDSAFGDTTYVDEFYGVNEEKPADEKTDADAKMEAEQKMEVDAKAETEKKTEADSSAAPEIKKSAVKKPVNQIENLDNAKRTADPKSAVANTLNMFKK